MDQKKKWWEYNKKQLKNEIKAIVTLMQSERLTQVVNYMMTLIAKTLFFHGYFIHLEV